MLYKTKTGYGKAKTCIKLKRADFASIWDATVLTDHFKQSIKFQEENEIY